MVLIFPTVDDVELENRRCWADRVSRFDENEIVPCDNLGQAPLGLCEEHDLEIRRAPADRKP